VVVLTAINLSGVKESARASDLFTISKLLPLIAFVAVGLFFISPARFTLATRPGLRPFSAAVFILIYAFSGFEAVLVNSGEIREPQRIIPFGLVVALSTSVALFLLIQIVCIGTLPQLMNSERPLADASYTFLGALGPTMISAAALIGIFGTLNVIMLACTRLPFAMAAHGQLPVFLSRVHRRFRTPHVSILVSAAAVLLLGLPGTFLYALKFTVITRVIVYASTCAALPVLRRRGRMAEPTRTRNEVLASFEVPAGRLISTGCVILCFWLLSNSGWREARDVAIAIAVGLIIYLATRLGQRRAEPL
jgi:amino acid transporter